MQVARRALAGSSRALRAPGYATQRALSTVSDAPTNNLPDELPWFVDPAFETRPAPPHQQPVRTGDSHPPFPPEAASVSSLERLYGALSKSPLLEPATLLVCKPPNRPPGPALPEAMPRGRRKRGGTDLGEGVERLKGVPESGGMWNWIVLAQVKDGAEKRGGIESVVRLVRGTLLKGTPPVTLPPNSKKLPADGWAMVDAGNFAVHVISRSARDRFFENRDLW